MFKMYLKRDKEALQHLLSINKQMIFLDGVVCSVHPGLFAFSAIFHKSIGSKRPVLADCAFLESFTKSKQLDEMIFDVEHGEFTVARPYKSGARIEEQADSGLLDEAYKRLEIIEGVKDLDPEAVFSAGNKDRTLSFFEIDNGIFLDMLQRVGIEENMEFTITKNEVRIANSKAWAAFELPGMNKEVSIILTEDTLPVLKSAFMEKEQAEIGKEERTSSIICVVDESFVVVTNRASTIINSMVE